MSEDQHSTSYATDAALKPAYGPGWDNVHHVLRNVIGMTYGAAQQAIFDYREAHGEALVQLTEPANRHAYVTAAYVYAFATRELPREEGNIIAEHERKAWRRLDEARKRVKDAEATDSDSTIRAARANYAWYQSAWGALNNLRRDHRERTVVRVERGENEDE